MYIHISYHHIGSMCVSSTCLFHIIHSLYSSWRKKPRHLMMSSTRMIISAASEIPSAHHGLMSWIPSRSARKSKVLRQTIPMVYTYVYIHVYACIYIYIYICMI